MNDPYTKPAPEKGFAESFALLEELEANKSDAIRQLRADKRVSIKAKVLIQPGNSGDLHRMKIQGVTGDVSRRGCLVLVPGPLLVGDVYRLTFDRAALDLPMVFARCLRCRLIREEAFESGFSFFSPIELLAGDDHHRAPAEVARD